MGQIAAVIRDVEAAIEREGEAPFARRANVPLTTLRDLRAKRFRTKAVVHLEQLHEQALVKVGGSAADDA